MVRVDLFDQQGSSSLNSTTYIRILYAKLSDSDLSKVIVIVVKVVAEFSSPSLRKWVAILPSYYLYSAGRWACGKLLKPFADWFDAIDKVDTCTFGSFGH